MVTMASQPEPHSGSLGRLSYQPPPDDGPVPRTLEFIRNQLPAWRDDPERPQESSERRLNASLCSHLNSRARMQFPMVTFQPEEPQTGPRDVDFGVHGADSILVGTRHYTIYEPFLVIEAKRLPTPPPKNREREYVTGGEKLSGGIQRFKLGLHGAHVETAAIVGYIEKDTPHHWLLLINGWLAELAADTTTDGCVWNDSETLQHLQCDTVNDIASSISIHQRESGCLSTTITLHHLWVVMNSRTLMPD